MKELSEEQKTLKGKGGGGYSGTADGVEHPNAAG